MRDSWLPFLTRTLPRYTSYPTAADFHDGVGNADREQALHLVSLYEPLSLYIHVPFCAQLCWYCGCSMTVGNNAERVQRYVEALRAEIAHIGRELAGHGRVVTVHFGGGTPNFLAIAQLDSILEAIEQHIGLTDGVSIAIELDPRLADVAQARALAALGVTRVSLGVQDTDATVQRQINRIQPLNHIARVTGALRTAGIVDIGFDLIYGLPEQTLGTVSRTVENVIALDPDRLAVFGYAHVPHMRPHQRMIDTAKLADGGMRLALAEQMSDLLLGAGYIEIGFDHFARPQSRIAVAAQKGKLNRNFQGFTEDPASSLIGIGASAISQFEDAYTQNEKHIGRYREGVLTRGASVSRGVLLSREDRLRRSIIHDLLCRFSCDISARCEEYGVPIDRLARSFAALAPLFDAEIIQDRSRHVAIRPEARKLSRLVAHAFDARSTTGVGQFSAAV